jgi:hypothetical protein
MAPLNTSDRLTMFRCSLLVSARSVRAFQIPFYGAAPSGREPPHKLCEHELEKDHDVEAIH